MASLSMTARAVQKLCCPSDFWPRATQHIDSACAQDRAHSIVYIPVFEGVVLVEGSGFELLGVTQDSRYCGSARLCGAGGCGVQQDVAVLG